MGVIYTGIDGRKVVSISYSHFRKEWEFTKREGRKIYVIPSHLSLLKIEEMDIKSRYTLKKYISIEVQERYGDVKWDLNTDEGMVYVVLFKDFEEPPDYFALDSEIFALARVLRAVNKEDGVVLDIGENKTTYVDVSGGKIKNYRVVLKGGRYIDKKVSEAYGIEFDEADNIKRNEGINNVKVKEAFENILSSIGHNFQGKEVLLSGGVSLLRGVDKYFTRVFRNHHCEPHLNTAFGAALKYVYRDKSPDFRKEGIEPSDIRRFAIAGGITALLLVSSTLAIHLGGNIVLDNIKDMQKKEFKEAFPNLPAVSVYEQVKGLISSGDKYVLTKKWEKLLKKLKQGVVIYSVEYNGDTIIIKGEAEENLVKLLEPKVMKKTPKGNIEFEVEIK